MADPLAITPHASGAEAASGAGPAVDIGALRNCCKLTLTVSDLTGTSANLAVVVETAATATGPWSQVGVFPGLTVARSLDGVFADCRRYVRVRWTLTGTGPSATFEVAGEGHVLYASLAYLDRLGIAKAVTSTASVEDKALHALAATGEAEGYLAGGYSMPLVAWTDELRRHVARIWSYEVMCTKGFQPQGSDELIVKGRDDAISWLSKVNSGALKPPGIVDSTPEVEESAVIVVSGAPSGDYWP